MLPSFWRRALIPAISLPLALSSPVLTGLDADVSAPEEGDDPSILRMEVTALVKELGRHTVHGPLPSLPSTSARPIPRGGQPEPLLQPQDEPRAHTGPRVCTVFAGQLARHAAALAALALSLRPDHTRP